MTDGREYLRGRYRGPLRRLPEDGAAPAAPDEATSRNRIDPMTENTAHCKRDQPEQAAFYTVKETAQHLRLCEKQIRRLIERGDLPAYRFGTALRIKKQAIDAYAEARRV
jgi:excisionase family DNA binding protein